MSERNAPSPDGVALGKELARLCDAAEREKRAWYPKHAERCVSCAFRGGSFPNGCAETVLDALKCVIEQRPFLCHMSPKDDTGEHAELCAGWLLSVDYDKPPGVAPWPWTDAAEQPK